MTSGKIAIVKNVALHDMTTMEGILVILNQIFGDKKQPSSMWGPDIKSFCFQNGIVPKVFQYPN